MEIDITAEIVRNYMEDAEAVGGVRVRLADGRLRPTSRLGAPPDGSDTMTEAIGAAA
ncbi:MAG: hypothetical protein ACJ76L_05000 [Conexibacter sp.]